MKLNQNQKDILEITYQFWASTLTFFLALKSYELVSIPLIIGLIVLVYRSNKKIPQNALKRKIKV